MISGFAMFTQIPFVNYILKFPCAHQLLWKLSTEDVLHLLWNFVFLRAEDGRTSTVFVAPVTGNQQRTTGVILSREISSHTLFD